MHPSLRTSFTELVGVRYPIVQTGMGWVAGARLTAATSNAGGLGILASATMTFEELVHQVAEVKTRTSEPFAVNLRADSGDVLDRVKLLIEQKVRVASFAQAPKKDLIDRLHDGGVLVMPSIGAKRHAEKVLEWGVDAVLVQGGEGGGHTGSVPTTLLLPQVVDTVAGRVPVVAAGGFFDGRGLVAALAYGADAIAMGTRFLLTSDSVVPDAIKQVYLATPVTGTVVSTRVDGVPHRVLRTPLVDKLESARPVAGLPRAVANGFRFRKISGLSWAQMVREGLAMKKSNELPWSAVIQAANTPMLLKATMVDGNVDAGVMASGQVAGLIDDLPSCTELIERIMNEADAVLNRLTAAAPLTKGHER
jgi:NAD(P)H-dependent flavin oxidoreductase YrpB (nitropropane dioxygenase family)